MDRKEHGRTAGGEPLTDELVAKLAARAEEGYNVDETLRRRGGRPTLGSGPAAVESVRLEPELREALRARAEHDQESPSALIRKALRQYLAEDRLNRRRAARRSVRR
jgi:hypothetical protein